MLKRICFLSLCLLWAAPSYAASILLDAEVQNWLEDMLAPLVQIAGLDAADVEVGVVLDDNVNAFATLNPHGGHSIYVYSGLVEKAKDEEEVRGVLAHELGHVKANHLFELQSNMAAAKWKMLAGAAIGLGGALAGGGSDAAVAGVLGGQAAATSGLLSYSRTQEREADNLAQQFLAQEGKTLDGMYRFMQTLRNENLLLYRMPPPYLQSHPQPAERLDSIHNALGRDALPARPSETFKRVQAKMYAFKNSAGQTARKYMGEDVPNRMARAIAYMNTSQLKRAKEEVEALQKALPEDPYIQEIAAHLALENREYPQALALFQTAQRGIHSPLIDFHIVRVYLAMLRGEDPAEASFQQNMTHALNYAQRVVLAMPNWPRAHQQMGVVLGRMKRLAESHISLAEAAYLQDDARQARQHIQLAEKYAKAEKDLPQKTLAKLALLKTLVETLEATPPRNR